LCFYCAVAREKQQNQYDRCIFAHGGYKNNLFCGF
jgi:hypothetical protein